MGEYGIKELASPEDYISGSGYLVEMKRRKSNEKIVNIYIDQIRNYFERVRNYFKEPVTMSYSIS